ncbi:ABC transporter permease [Chitinophaga sancti]|uniref:ABC transporter permease n=1 Tax=Chitinophaga sancti TaxID=1004 RepID=A0A1K1PDI8_9BACT|nr:ABC transporter permease [Chitinophaga sancti]WQD65781.1 ABC transporter permease [Chitinophaga sancti]WQG88597.1 ABC transporter permease [Chitinophaga sancti]SFW45553.1 putative ABC transport system permease protein [Chitinophaga sancti]
MQFRDIFSLAYSSVSANRLRAGLTISIIAFGIMALVGILTATESMKNSIYSSFASMGANSFSIQNRALRIFMGDGPDAKKSDKQKKKVKTSNANIPITWVEARDFSRRFSFPATVSVSVTASGGATVYKGDNKTNPNIQVLGGDENYLEFSNYKLKEGRNFNQLDMETGRNVAILGTDVAKKLYGDAMKNVINSNIRVGNVRYRVIGLLEAKGNSGFMSADKVVITTVTNTRRVYGGNSMTYNIGVSVKDINHMDAAVGEATGLFRIIRHLHVNEEENFYISKSDSIGEMLFSNLSYVVAAAALIGIITLFGSAIGLTNIMLVSVAERTREIGVNKALGATRTVIRRQFVYESIIISVLGGALGVLLGMLVGNVVSLLMHTSFVIPWFWIFAGISLCAGVGLMAGIFPAIKASKLDPIIALRYE